jgi:electron transfer flavoprotein beta subunit
MNIIVCVKPAPDPKKWDTIQLDPVTKALQRGGIPNVLGPLDKRALEEGLRLKEKYGGKVAVMAMAPPSARENLVEALAMGADEAYLLSDRLFAGSDTWATSLVLAKGIRKAGTWDLVICGSWSLDGSTGHVGAQLAEFLGIWNVSQVTAVESIEDNQVRTRSQIERGYRVMTTPLPALITVAHEINSPRFISLFGVMEAESKPLQTWSAKDIEINPEEVGFSGSPTQTGDVFIPPLKRKAEMLRGEPEEMVKEIVHKIRQALG